MEQSPPVYWVPVIRTPAEHWAAAVALAAFHDEIMGRPGRPSAVWLEILDAEPPSGVGPQHE